MGFRFRKAFSILPGVKVNMSKSGPSLSVGGKGLTTNFGRKGTKTTVGLPGSGMSYSSYKRYGKGGSSEEGGPARGPAPLRLGSLIPIFIICVVFYAIYQGGGLSNIIKTKVTEATQALRQTGTQEALQDKAHLTPSQENTAVRAFTVAPSATAACGLPYPCQLRTILDSSDWPAVSTAFAGALLHDDGERVEWAGAVPARRGYVRRGKVLASGDCTSYAVAAHVGGKTVIRHVKLCNRAGGPPELK